ncbi:MAG TPA: membrane protein insertase YidC [Spirochaetia bacterium]|nr:membrane protein insertase YidC [Spirochaetia bacterium]
MDRKTLLAVVISVVVITLGFTIQSLIFTPKPSADQSATTPQTTQQQAQSSTGTATGTNAAPAGEAPALQQNAQVGAAQSGTNVVPVPESGLVDKQYQLSTDLFNVTFSSRGGDVVKFDLVKHQDNNIPVNMVDRGTSDQAAFQLHFGGPQAPAVTALFQYRRINKDTVEFTRQFYLEGHPDKPFTLTKTYSFKPNDYMVNVSISIRNSVNESIPLSNNNVSYTLGYGPQIGPTFTTLDGRNDFRKFIYVVSGKKSEVSLRPDTTQEVTKQVDWASIVGKYFTVIGVPDNAGYTVTFSSKPVTGVNAADRLYFSRSLIHSSQATDVFRFYVGPKVQRDLDKYMQASSNAWGLSNLNLSDALDARVLLGWLENILKFFMQLFYRVIPNYGVAIILLTVLVKVLLYPLTRKSFQSTARMQQLTPKIEELRAKYKDNPTKMNQEMAGLYKKEGVNPIGGCLPMLLQFPIFIAMYGLFNNHFDLRGAVFIPGWITDLSAPETIWHFGNNFQLPILGWTDLRLLPIIYVASQIVSSKLTQAPTTASNSQMKLMMFGLPVVFFFILYNVPSGLLVYWIVTNVLSAAQQYYITKIRYPHLHPRAVVPTKKQPGTRPPSKLKSK